MMRLASFLLLLGALLPAASLWAEETAPDTPPAGAVPFPVARTTKVTARDGPVYYVDGPTVIPRSAEITVLLDVQIVGINGASLDVQGGLKVHGTEGHTVKIRDVDLSPTREPRHGVHLDMVQMRGCRLVHAEGDGFTGDLTIENALVMRDCALDVRMREGTLKLMSIESRIPWAIRCESPDPRTKKIDVHVRSCVTLDVQLSGYCDATFRHSAIQAGLLCRGVSEVVVDGCDISETLAFHQGPEDVFREIALTKCNLFWGCTLVLDREANEQAPLENVRVDKFYFGPEEGPGAVTKKEEVQALIEDAEDVEHRRVTARLTSLARKKHLLVDYDRIRRRDRRGGAVGGRSR